MTQICPKVVGQPQIAEDKSKPRRHTRPVVTDLAALVSQGICQASLCCTGTGTGCTSDYTSWQRQVPRQASHHEGSSDPANRGTNATKA